MRQFVRRCFVLSGVSLALAGCLSPTLPLPPPVQPEVEPVGNGQYELRGEIPDPGFVLFLNKRTNVVNGALTDRKYTVVISAQPKDAMQLWYESGNEVSDIVEFEIPESQDPPAGDAGAPPADGTN